MFGYDMTRLQTCYRSYKNSAYIVRIISPVFNTCVFCATVIFCYNHTMRPLCEELAEVAALPCSELNRSIPHSGPITACPVLFGAYALTVTPKACNRNGVSFTVNNHHIPVQKLHYLSRVTFSSCCELSYHSVVFIQTAQRVLHLLHLREYVFNDSFSFLLITKPGVVCYFLNSPLMLVSYFKKSRGYLEIIQRHRADASVIGSSIC